MSAGGGSVGRGGIFDVGRASHVFMMMLMMMMMMMMTMVQVYKKKKKKKIDKNKHKIDCSKRKGVFEHAKNAHIHSAHAQSLIRVLALN